MKQFVYFFKQNNIDAIKIGRASGESINDRFQSFKTYSPFGAEIIGYYECLNSIEEEKRLHKKYAAYRLNGEFFQISKEKALLECKLNNTDIEKINTMVLELIQSGIELLYLKESLITISKSLINKKERSEENNVYFNALKLMPKFFKTKDYLIEAEKSGVKQGAAKMYLNRVLNKFISKNSFGNYMKLID